MKPNLTRILSFIKLIGSPNWYKGTDKPTFYQRIYKWRVGFKTAWKVSGIIWSKNKTVK